MLLQIEDVVVPTWCLKIKTSFFFQKNRFFEMYEIYILSQLIAQNIERLESEKIVNSEALELS